MKLIDTATTNVKQSIQTNLITFCSTMEILELKQDKNQQKLNKMK
jgi:hypothetical protein